MLRKYLAATFLITAVLGCGGPPTVTGTVTYDGKPINQGTISFSSTDGSGSPFGATIKNGEYHAKKAQLGTRRVAVTGYEMPPVPPGSKEPVFAVDTVPPNAVGNGQEVEIVPGAQTMDFHLKPPQ